MKPEDFLLMTEAQIMGYGESDSSGCWIKLQIQPEELAKLRGKKGVACEFTLREVDEMTGQLKDSGHPSPAKGGRHCKDAVLMCKHPNFQAFAKATCGHYNIEVPADHDPEDLAKKLIYVVCGVGSRAELDGSPEASQQFIQLCRTYSTWVSSK